MKIAIYSPIKDEHFLIEWINYYLKIGIKFFILFQDKDSDTDINNIMIHNNINQLYYKILYYNSKIHNNNLFYHNKVSHWYNLIIPELHSNNIDYLLQIDADEFLFLDKFENIKDLIKHYEPFDSMKFNWLFFGSNEVIKNNTNSIIHTFNRSSNYLNSHIKSLTKVKSIDMSKFIVQEDSVNPHYINLLPNSICKNVSNQIIDNGAFSHTNLNILSIYIAHYACQDLSTYIKRKFCSENFIFYWKLWYSSNKVEITDDNIIKNIKFINNNFEDFLKYIILIKNNKTDCDYLVLKDKFKQINYDVILFIIKYFNQIDLNNIENNDIINRYVK